ncbi:pyridoxamine 5'-phosphate oxidase family protein [Epibacterium sp. SM1969]|uniref:Pyridoxamine 5'-phosphate oxidase family protein n=1 Tax=Tritonibacter aquimaris TaxID=2663379 RepID=A0A844AP28_9RHOB|nr:pyridoxamine 5'-phosphate oxidase family protein [Tritonibacter aquimaris]MQY42343.1 pyridoxamine 5'-phosphate oxidase family protein [Tritonibacter aquimaris]
MDTIQTLDQLEALYGKPGAPSVRKVVSELTPLYRKWIMTSRFCVLSTVGPEGTDGSPRGDEGPVVMELDAKTLALPDWRGNNRIDSLRNIVRDERVSLMFMVPGSNNVIRVNGTAKLTADAELRARFEKHDKQPATVIVITINEIYSQCARALIRSKTWTSGDQSEDLPTVGQLLAEATAGEEGGETYDREWAPRAAKTMW